MEEAKTINKSISALGNCIAALANENKKIKFNNFTTSHIPFRDSKLTRLLSESLRFQSFDKSLYFNYSGCSKTNLVACINGTLANYDETYSTLLFASRAMKIRVNVQMHEEIYFKVIYLIYFPIICLRC